MKNTIVNSPIPAAAAGRDSNSSSSCVQHLQLPCCVLWPGGVCHATATVAMERPIPYYLFSG
jgi:hypothetical protein